MMSHVAEKVQSDFGFLEPIRLVGHNLIATKEVGHVLSISIAHTPHLFSPDCKCPGPDVLESSYLHFQSGLDRKRANFVETVEARLLICAPLVLSRGAVPSFSLRSALALS